MSSDDALAVVGLEGDELGYLLGKVAGLRVTG